MELEKFQGIITKYNVDSNGSFITIPKEEEQQIHPLKFNISTGIIDESEGFTILNREMYAVQNYDDIQNPNQYWVDYEGGRVYFHSSLKGSAIRYRYGDRGDNLLNATRIFTKLDEKGNVVELLSELIDLTREYIAILGTFEQATIVIKKLEQTINNCNLTKEQLDQSIANAQDDIATIKATGNEMVNITSSEWVYNDTSKMYEKKINHNCYSENVHVTCKSSDTKDVLFLPWKSVDKRNILLKSDEAINVSVVISASYYKATQTVSDDIVSEIIEARKGSSTLGNKISKIESEVDLKTNNIDEDRTTNSKTVTGAINELNNDKVDKVTGKGLSTNDFDDNLLTLLRAWEDFKANGGEIGGSVITGDNTNESYLPFIAKRLNEDKKLIEIHYGVTDTGSGTLMRMVEGVNGGRYDFDWRGFYPVYSDNANRSLGIEEQVWSDIYLKGISKNTNGYTKLPNGFILQWGSFQKVNAESRNFDMWGTYPIAFPNKCLTVVGTVNSMDSNSNPRILGNYFINSSNTQFRCRVGEIDLPYASTITDTRVFWLALGY